MRTLDVQQGAWIHRARTRRHRNAFERREAHRRVQGASITDGRDRAATTEVAHDQAPSSLFAEQFGRTLRGPLNGEPVEAVPPDPPVLAPGSRNRVGRGLGRHAGVECGVEHRDVRMRGQQPPCVVDGFECGRVVKWRNLRELLDRRAHLVVDHRRLDEMPSVDDTVTDRTDLLRANGLEILDDLHALVLHDEVQLEAGGPGVDDENREHALSRARSSRGSPDRRRRAHAYTREPRDAGPPSPAADVRQW